MKKKYYSTVSAKQALAALLAVGYETQPRDPDRRIRPTERETYKRTPDVALSISGKSVRLYFNGSSQDGESQPKMRAAEIHVPAKGMLTRREAETLEQLAKIKFDDFKPR